MCGMCGGASVNKEWLADLLDSLCDEDIKRDIIIPAVEQAISYCQLAIKHDGDDDCRKSLILMTWRGILTAINRIEVC
ncbi:hypothetical protein ACFL6S_37660 [Candidatus Poribacteria bacterium]